MPVYGPDHVIVLNQGLGELELRTRASGKQRATIVVRSEPLVINLDPKQLGMPVAAAIVEHLRERVQSITVVARPATLLARKYAKTAFDKAKPWAMQQFAGGKMGPMAPAQSDRLFNNSGRFEKSITGNASSDGSWRINVASNRLNEQSAGAAGTRSIWNKLVSLVPEFGNPAMLLNSPKVEAAIKQSLADMIRKERETTGKLTMQLIRSVLDLAKTVASFGDLLAE